VVPFLAHGDLPQGWAQVWVCPRQALLTWMCHSYPTREAWTGVCLQCQGSPGKWGSDSTLPGGLKEGPKKVDVEPGLVGKQGAEAGKSKSRCLERSGWCGEQGQGCEGQVAAGPRGSTRHHPGGTWCPLWGNALGTLDQAVDAKVGQAIWGPIRLLACLMGESWVSEKTWGTGLSCRMCSIHVC
jgi:hypothetical protein